MERLSTVVLGAGVVGLAVARALVRPGKRRRDVIVVDRAVRVGAETSSRNSEVIHAGIYYPPTSLKAKFCVQGKALMYDFCQKRNIPYTRLGKLMVASDPQDWSELQRLQQQAQDNGVTDTRLVSKDEARELEPNVVCEGGLFSPSTGILDSLSFMEHLLADAEDLGAIVALHSNFQEGRIGNDGIELKVNGTWFLCEQVVNAAGLWADDIATKIHSNHVWNPPRQYYAKGNYFRLTGVKTPFSHLVYPVPDRRGGLGKSVDVGMGGNDRHRRDELF